MKIKRKITEYRYSLEGVDLLHELPRKGLMFFSYAPKEYDLVLGIFTGHQKEVANALEYYIL